MDYSKLAHLKSRRRFLSESAAGIGMIALSHLLGLEGRAGLLSEATLGANPLAPKAPHFAPKAKNVIFLFMAGGPSQMDLFDPKPEMVKWQGQTLPESMREKVTLAFVKPTAKIWASPRVFKRHGQCGMEFCDFMPQTATWADEICMIRSMQTDQINHHPGQLMMNCGSPLPGRPTMGSWVAYGLGSESQDLPGYVVLRSSGDASAGSQNWTSGFLPSVYQGVPFRSGEEPVLFLSNPPGVSRKAQRSQLDLIRDLNQQHQLETGDVEIASRMASYELAFRMQMAAPGLLDLSGESQRTLEMYGVNQEPTEKYGLSCLLARRMVERGIRFVQLIHSGWDHHGELTKGLKKACETTDSPTAALLKDLKQRGLLESTLVIWGGEFGRTPIVEERSGTGEDGWGRDHHGLAFSLWMAGGGIKGGQVIGKTDELAFNILEEPVHVHDLHATILHCLGLEHERLTYRHQGRDFRLTDVAGNVVERMVV